jgi:hypothetical protein
LIEQDEALSTEPDCEPRPRWGFVAAGMAAVSAISVLTLPWPIALLSVALGALMLVGAGVDARF